jgi:hypothetical protein
VGRFRQVGVIDKCLGGPKMASRSLVATTVTVLLFGAASATAAPARKSYKNCTALNKVYAHGVGRNGARDKTSASHRVTNFKVSNRVFAYNDGKTPRHRGEKDLDRDNDGIACEKV